MDAGPDVRAGQADAGLADVNPALAGQPQPQRVIGLPPRLRLPLLVLAMLGLVAGIAGGLVRLGVAVPLPSAHTSVQHGVLMVCGFFGTLISLERAVALKNLWAYAAPLTAAAGALLMAGGWTASGAAALVVAGGLLSAASAVVHRRQPALFTKVLLAGACAWTLGNGMMAATGSAHAAEPWWIAFFVLTIAGERLELNRMLAPRPRTQGLFVAIVLALLAGAAYAAFSGNAYPAALGGALAAMALWLVLNDIARRTIHGQGLPRYIAVSLLSGYGWLLAAGVLSGVAGSMAAGPFVHDAFLHAVFVGFVFSMVFGHAPIILPAVIGIRFRYTAWLYVPLALLHASLVCRVSGDLAGSMPLRTLGSLLNAAAIAIFAATTLTLVAAAGTARSSTR